MKAAGLLATGLAAVLATSAVMAQDWGRTPAPDEASLVRGRMIAIGGTYGEASWACVQCHGLTGAGDGSGAFPRLTDQSAWYLFKTLQDYAAGLRPNEAMQAVARLLTREQMRDVAAWYASLEDVPYPAEVPAPKQDMVQLGARIATAGIREQGVPACQGCHGPMGVGQPPLYPYLAGQYAPYTAHQLHLWKQGRRDGDPMNVMELIAKAMTDEQIEAVAVYFASLRPEEVTPVDLGFGDEGATDREAAPGTGRQAPAMGVLQNPEATTDEVVVPGADPAMGDAPEPDFPLGVLRPPLEEGELPPGATGDADLNTMTTTGRPQNAGGGPDDE
ncbi:c-type cytochrome [Arenibaculum sp.]|jgi:cytochrome c553|uniref:c-type cytochrome n=1 Tax=Arenibaculum sp. TaxID=2865862 RepID=UPI002E122C7F|nr:c-type cytochrome [Arenibaculum sp.]